MVNGKGEMTLEHEATREPVSEYAMREAKHTAFAVAITVLVALAFDVQGMTTFDRAALAGLAVTAVRTLATVVITLYGRRVIS